MVLARTNSFDYCSVLKEGKEAAEEEIIEFVKGGVVAYKRIRKAEFRKDLLMTPVGKVLRKALRDEELKRKQ